MSERSPRMSARHEDASSGEHLPQDEDQLTDDDLDGVAGGNPQLPASGATEPRSNGQFQMGGGDDLKSLLEPFNNDLGDLREHVAKSKAPASEPSPRPTRGTRLRR